MVGGQITEGRGRRIGPWFKRRKNHPFLDGNKRVALATALVFLRLNGQQPEPDRSDWETLVLDITAGKLEREEATERLRTLVTE